MATPSLAMIPSAYADSKVYSVLPNNGDGDFTFNRDSSATRVGQNGLIQTVGFFGNELITNGSFDTDSDWTKNSWTISNGKANSGSTSSLLEQLNVYTSTSIIYKTVIKARSVNGSSVTLRVYDGSGNNYETLTITSSSFQEFTIERARAGNSSTLFFYNDSNAQIEIDNVSVKEVTGDQPRLNYDISNGVVQSCPSLLLEGASTNLVTSSNNFAASGWNNFASITPIPNSLTSPEGIQNASTLACSGSNVFRYSFTSTTNTNYVGSVFVKAKETTNDFGIQTLESGTPYVSVFNIQSGVVVTQASNHTASIENFGNGWFRCIVKFNSGSTTSNIFDFKGSSSPIIKSFYGFGAQLEALSYATSYIPTNGASQTRAAETCFGAGNAATFNSTEGVLYAEISALANDGTYRILALSDGTSDERVYIQYTNASNTVAVVVKNGGSTQANMSFGLTDETQFNKIAIKYKANDFALWVNGVKVLTDNSGSVPSGLSELAFDSGTGSNDFYGKCKDIRVYNEALTDAQLIALTT